MAAFFDALSCMTSLTILDLTFKAPLCIEGGRALARALSRSSSIKSLSLTGNQLRESAADIVSSVVHLSGLTCLNLRRNDVCADTAARMLGSIAAAGLTQLHTLRLDGLSSSAVVSSVAWNDLKLPRPPDEILKNNDLMTLLQYILSDDKIAINAIRLFVIGDSTVRCVGIVVNAAFVCVSFPHFHAIIMCI